MNFKKLLFVLSLTLFIIATSVVCFADTEEAELDTIVSYTDTVEIVEGSDDELVMAGGALASDTSAEDTVLAVEEEKDAEESLEVLASDTEAVTSVLTDGDTTYSAPEEANDTADDTAAADMQDLAKTGMTQWPIIVCGIAGGVLIIIGIILVVNSKKKKVK